MAAPSSGSSAIDRVGHTGAVNCTYRGHRQPDRGHTVEQSTVHTEGTDNQTWGTSGAVNCTYRGHRQPDRRNTVGHSGAINCTYRGHRQPDRGHTVGQ